MEPSSWFPFGAAMAIVTIWGVSSGWKISPGLVLPYNQIVKKSNSYFSFQNHSIVKLITYLFNHVLVVKVLQKGILGSRVLVVG